MKNQALFSSKDKKEKLKCCLLQFLFGAFMVNEHQNCQRDFQTDKIKRWTGAEIKQSESETDDPISTCT